MKLKLKKFFNGMLACCLVFGFQSACGAVLCIGADGQISIEMTCGMSGLPQQHGAVSFPLHSDILPDQEGNASCDQCAVDIPIPGVPDGLRITTPGRSLPLQPVYNLPALFYPDAGRDRCKAACDCAAPAFLDHSISLLRTTILLI